jgi:D-3-phosphoglycerate dehydrogenase / 2-oxoglutarate reductase
MIKILANDGISAAGKQQLEAAGFTVVTDNVPQEQLIDDINNKQYDVLLVRSATKIRKDIIDACPSLKLLGRGGVGMDNIDVEYACSKGLMVVNTPASSSQSVAELVIGQMFSISRMTFDSERKMPSANTKEAFNELKKKYGKGVELRGKTLGIIGFGRIGKSIAQYAIGCGMNVIANDGYNNKDSEEITLDIVNQKIKVVVNYVSKKDLLAQSDYISVNVPMPEDGDPVIGANEFSLMKNNVRIVNAARGGVIDEAALLDALNNGKVAAAALDVFENEPVVNPAILAHEKIALTPHIGAATNEAQDRIGGELADIIIAHFKK